MEDKKTVIDVNELIERLGVTSADISVPPEVASEIDEAIAALTCLSEANKDARIDELRAALKGCADNQKRCEGVITYMKRRIPDLPSYKSNTERTHQALSEETAKLKQLKAEPEHEISEFVELVLEQGVQLSSPLATSTLKFAATVERVRENMESERRNDRDDLDFLESYGLLNSEVLTKHDIENDITFDGAEAGDTMWSGSYLGHMLDEIVGDYLQAQAVKYYARQAPTKKAAP